LSSSGVHDDSGDDADDDEDVVEMTTTMLRRIAVGAPVVVLDVLQHS
jgi:hypothetical protein